MKYVPVFIDLSRIRILIFGGGKVALRKIEYLKDANITVVSENFDDEILKKNVKTIRKKIENEEDAIEFINNSDFVIVATSDKKTNRIITSACEKLGKLYNLVDDKKSLTIFPAYYENKGIILAVSTSGKAPSLSSFIRDKLSLEIDNYVDSVDVIEKIRTNLDSHNEYERKEFFRKLFQQEEFWKLIKNKEFEKAYDFAMCLWRNRDVPDQCSGYI